MENKKSKKAELETKRPIFFLVGLLLSLSFVFAAFEWKNEANQTIEFEGIDLGTPDTEIIPIVREKKEEIAPPVKTVTEFILADNDMEIDEDLEIVDMEISEGEAIDYKNYLTKEKEIEEEIPATWFPEENPEFPGGMKALIKFIATSVKYPVVAQENGIQGRVIVTFVIGKDGSVNNIKVARGVDPALDKEAIRVVQNLPTWKPGKQNGKPVKVNYNVPINFVLQ